jgi:hypothetical protein
MLLEDFEESRAKIASIMGTMKGLETKKDLTVIPFLVNEVAGNCYECLIERRCPAVKCN